MRDLAFHFAEEYVQRGYSVIPLVGKFPPPGLSYRDYQQRRATLNEVRTWFGEGSCEHYNVGIVTGGISSITVVVCGTEDDARWWVETFPVTPLVVRTGRGAAHMYYCMNPADGMRSHAHVFGRNIDVHQNGSYVLAPPSRHPATGLVYEWQPWGYFALDEVPMFDSRWCKSACHRTVSALSQC